MFRQCEGLCSHFGEHRFVAESIGTGLIRMLRVRGGGVCYGGDIGKQEEILGF